MADSPDTAAAGKGLFDFSFGTEARGDRSGHSVGDYLHSWCALNRIYSTLPAAVFVNLAKAELRVDHRLGM